jgi:hypothetical protein
MLDSYMSIEKREISRDDEIYALLGVLFSYDVTPDKYKEIYNKRQEEIKNHLNDLGLSLPPTEI